MAALLASAPIAGPASPPVTAALEVEPGSFTVGDPIRITLRITYPEGAEVGAAAPGEQWGKLQVLGFEPGEPRRSEAGVWVREDRLLCAAFAPGPLQTPPLSIPYRSAGGQTGEARTPPLDLVIESVLARPGEAEISDLKSPHSLPRALWPWIAGAVAVLAAAAALAYYLGWRRRRHLRDLLASSREPPLPPHEWALRELDRLASSGWLADGRWLDYHVLLAEVLKGYLSRRYGIQTLELTTSELVHSMRAVRLDGGLVADVREVLEPCDRVKFARHIPVRAEAETVLGRARAFVSVTRPPQPAAEAAG